MAKRAHVYPQVELAAADLVDVPVASAPAEEISHYDGEQLYHRFCAACHGETGEGDGPVASFFKVAPPDLTTVARRRGGEYPADDMRRIIDGRDIRGPHGSRQMPVWGMEFYYADTGNPDKQRQVEELIDRLVEYLRKIQMK
jgi:mono/diheme cytochrome c family protein